MRDFFPKLHRRNPVLASAGWLHVLLFLGTLIALTVDNRQVMGINVWIKPMKFMMSLAVYLWTVAWISAYVQRPRWLIRTISNFIATVMVIESVLILTQAARGVPSHFNEATALDGSLFAAMGIMIGIDTIMMVIILMMFIRPSVKLAPLYLWGIRAGILVFLFGGWIGGLMIVNGAHTIGAPDGGPGLPLFNWSTIAGDLRVAHGMGLHALQILPLIAYSLSRSRVVTGTARRICGFAVFAAVYLGAMVGIYWQAMRGQPLL